MYHLIFLSPMVHNVMEFCQSQLEWMSDSLSRSFYNGKPNPFDLPLLKVCTSVREMEKLYSGPKVVIATDSSLNCGCGKELLLKWGGDPRYSIVCSSSSCCCCWCCCCCYSVLFAMSLCSIGLFHNII